MYICVSTWGFQPAIYLNCLLIQYPPLSPNTHTCNSFSQHIHIRHSPHTLTHMCSIIDLWPVVVSLGGSWWCPRGTVSTASGLSPHYHCGCSSGLAWDGGRDSLETEFACCWLWRYIPSQGGLMHIVHFSDPLTLIALGGWSIERASGGVEH